MSDPSKAYEEGSSVNISSSDVRQGLVAAVDYRGDTTIHLKNGSILEGYLFNATIDRLDLFPKDSSEKKSVFLSDVETISFSGKDTAKGKSWDDWIKKKSAKTTES